MMIRISTIWRLVFVAPKRNVPSSCNIIAFFWVPVPPLFVFISLKWPNIFFFLKIKESGHLFFFFWLLHFLPFLWPTLFASSYWILWIYLSIYLSYWEMMLLLLLGHRSCLPAAAEACVHVVYIDGILSSCRYIPIIVYYKYLEEWKILDERERERDERLQVFECINEVVCGWLSSLSACLVICWRSIWVA